MSVAEADARDEGPRELTIDRRRVPPRGEDRRNLHTRMPGVWTDEQRQRLVNTRQQGAGELTISDRRRSPRRGKDRRNLATRVPGVWTDEERTRYIAERTHESLEMVNEDPRRI